jgi:hypothetical protein
VKPLRNFLRPANSPSGSRADPGETVPAQNPPPNGWTNLPTKIKSAIWIDLLIVLSAGTLVLLLQNQGWRSREMVNPDMIPYYQEAIDFLATGRWPDRGNVSSYKSYYPPGASYLLIPGVILFRDGRLQRLIGDALVFLGGIAFTYLCAREIGGRRVGVASALLVGISRMGFQTAIPIGNPFFIVTALFFLIRWIKNRSALMLGVALVLGILGAYHHLAVVVFFAVIPILWLIFRPPVKWRILLAAVLVGLVVWLPYLRLEIDRGFIDLRSLILLRSPEQIADGGTAQPIYCYSALSGEPDMREETYLPYIGGAEIERRVIYPLAGWKDRLAYASCRMLSNIDRNFDTELFLLSSNRTLNTAVWLVFITGWSVLGWIMLQAWKPAGRVLAAVRGREWILLPAAGIGALFLYVGLNPEFVSGFAADRSLNRNALLAILQLRDYLPWIWSAVFLGLFLSFREPDRKPEKIILLIAFSVPWILLMFLAEPGRPDRFWFMWPLQVMTVVLCLDWISRRLPRAGLAFSILAVAMGVAVLPIRLYADRLAAAAVEGYGGCDSDQWNVVLFLSGQAGTGGDRSLKVDYWLSGSQTPDDPDYPVFRFEDWTTYFLESWSGVDVLAPESQGNSTGGSWAVVDRRLGVPDPWEGIEPAAVFGYYLIYRLP